MGKIIVRAVTNIEPMQNEMCIRDRSGFKAALTDLFNKYARANKLLKDNEDSLSGEDIREGMTAVISIKIEDPQFEGQTKQKLGNNEARGAVSAIVSEQLTYFLEQNPSVAKRCV